MLDKKLGLLSLWVLLLSACTAEYRFVEGEFTRSTLDPAGDSSDDPTDDDNDGPVICDPFSGSSPVSPDNGIEGKLYYLKANDPHYSHVEDYFTKGTAVDATLQLSELNVPTRKFDSGFVTANGLEIENEKGELLTEYFALRLKTRIGLSDKDAEGKYQFALLSDDGSKMSYYDFNANKKGSMIVDNDGTHPTQLGCANAAISFKRNTRLDVEVDYFQGPRYHIALILMWRLRADNQTCSDPYCGYKNTNNSFFFDFNQVPSKPQAPYVELLSRGWKPLVPQNYWLPPKSKNQCL